MGISMLCPAVEPQVILPLYEVIKPIIKVRSENWYLKPIDPINTTLNKNIGVAGKVSKKVRYLHKISVFHKQRYPTPAEVLVQIPKKERRHICAFKLVNSKNKITRRQKKLLSRGLYMSYVNLYTR